MKKLVAVWLMIAMGVLLARADGLKCDICGAPITGTYLMMVDRVTTQSERVCLSCATNSHCFECDLPVRAGEGIRLPDGRVFCARDAKNIIQNEEAAKDVCRETRDGLDRLFSRYLSFPETNVELSIVDGFHLENLIRAPGFHADGSTVYGATASNPLQNGKLMHSIDILSCLSKARLEAICAHEYTHTWLNEHLSAQRKARLEGNPLEGFCELVAYKFMESRQESRQMEIILQNTYTHGQVQVLLAADQQYGFNAVMDWMLRGEDNRLSLEKLDRVRALEDTPYSPLKSPQVVWAPVTSAPPTAVPDILILKGISGTQQHRFALINNATFEPMEHGPVRVGQATVNLRCLEIRPDSVVVQLDGAKDKLQLFLHEPR